jgi:hypothetical protein
MADWDVLKDVVCLWQAYCAYAGAAENLSNIRNVEIVKNVFDHVPKQFAVQYMAFAESRLSVDVFRSAVDAISKWDTVTGGERQFEVESYPGAAVSYTGTKYIALVAKMVYASGELPQRVVEIGGGFGGFAYAAASLGVDVTVIDIPETSAAISNIMKSLECTKVTCLASTNNEQISALAPGFVVVSEHAWTSLNNAAKRFYAWNVFAKATAGWLTCKGHQSSTISLLEEAKVGPATVRSDVFCSFSSFGLSWNVLSTDAKETLLVPEPTTIVYEFGGLNPDAVLL